MRSLQNPVHLQYHYCRVVINIRPQLYLSLGRGGCAGWQSTALSSSAKTSLDSQTCCPALVVSIRNTAPLARLGWIIPNSTQLFCPILESRTLRFKPASGQDGDNYSSSRLTHHLQSRDECFGFGRVQARNTTQGVYVDHVNVRASASL
jgi:hypothetical protein